MKRITAVFLICVIIIICALALAGCSGNPGTVNSAGNLMNGVSGSIELTDAEMEGGLNNGGRDMVNKFAVALLQKSIGAHDSGTGREGSGDVGASRGNILISPISVLYALGMTTNGADTVTREQLLTVLSEGEYTGEAICGTSSTGEGDIYDECQGIINEYLRAYLNRIATNEARWNEIYGGGRNSDKAPALKIANSIWMKDDDSFSVNEEFLNTNANYYDAGMFLTDFDEKTVKTVNSWIEENTGGTIKDMLTELPEDAIMLLINALSFEADWADPYYDYEVREGTFYGESGDESVEFMTKSEYGYLEDNSDDSKGSAVGFIKEYSGFKYAFAALLPYEGTDIDDYIMGLSGARLGEILSSVKGEEVIATIPKFETKSSLSLKETLIAMGASDAFDLGAADFSKLGHSDVGNIAIGNVLHDTYIKVDEKGTKAGAATIVEMVTEGAMEDPEPPKVVRLDRPFVYMLIDAEENIPLFIGVLRDIE